MKAAGVTFGGTSDPLPIGSVVAYSGPTIPTGYLDADGSSQLRASYPDLFAAIGTTYGPGAVPGTTFALPNFVGTYTNFIIKATAAAASTTVVSETLIAVPLGSLQLYAGSVYPTGWLRADGTAISRTTYAGLFAIIGTTYGAGDGSTTFNLPNLASSGTGSPVYIIKVTLSGSVEPSTVAHASSHIRAGTDVIDGDQVQIDYVPSAYTRNAAATGAGAVTDLTAHLAGIDADKLRIGATAGGGLAGTYPNPTIGTVPKSALPSGTILQVQYYQATTQVNVTSTVIPAATPIGLSGSITPISTSSRILVELAIQVRTIGSGSGAGLRVLRNGAVAVGYTDAQNYAIGYTNAAQTPSGRYPFVGIDSPATTSATTYTVYGSSYSANGVDFQDDGQFASTMLLWEIA
jgi:microcystin-dependent protein